MAIRPEQSDELSIPLLLTKQEQVAIIGEAVRQIQIELFRLEVNQSMNGHNDSDLIPGSKQTYSHQRDLYELGLHRLEIAYPDHIDLLTG